MFTFVLWDTRVLSLLEELCITWVAAINSFTRMLNPWEGSVCVCICLYTCVLVCLWVYVCVCMYIYYHLQTNCFVVSQLFIYIYIYIYIYIVIHRQICFVLSELISVARQYLPVAGIETRLTQTSTLASDHSATRRY